MKVRGNAQQVVEKYLQLARDATSSGDRIMAESYFQHAEHYYRVMTANGGGPANNTANNNGHDNRDGNAANGNGRDKQARGQEEAPGVGPQPEIQEDSPQTEATDEASTTPPRETGDGQEPVSA